MKTLVDFYIMLAGFGDYPIILGRPWLHAMNAVVQDWRRITISLDGKNSGRKWFDMGSKRLLDEDLEDKDESSYEDLSKILEVDSDNKSSDEDADVGVL